MVYQFQFRRWLRTQALVPALALSIIIAGAFFSPLDARADAVAGAQALHDAQSFFQSGQYFRAARYGFAASQEDPGLKAESYSWITVSLTRAGLPNAASYFFIRTLQSDNNRAIRRVLTETQALIDKVGADLLRKYLIRHTRYEDYDLANRSAYLYALGKDALLADSPDRAIGYINGIKSGTNVYPYALELRGSAFAISGKNDQAIHDFKECQDVAKGMDLRARCIAGQARTLYQMDQFEEADRVYDQIPKQSLSWPDILFEQGWNSFAKQEYNRTLGKLVSYKSPALKFVYNSEIDVLRAQSFLALCLYSDANKVINEFNSRYTPVGEQIKAMVEQNGSNLDYFYNQGKAALADSIYTNIGVHQFMNRFIRGPYFQDLVKSERSSANELTTTRQFSRMESGSGKNLEAGFPGFLEQVLRWRVHTIRALGGAYVKNSSLDYYANLLSNFDKMSFIKLEMLRRAKDKLIYKNAQTADRSRGNIEPSRRDDQMYWSFNGEFWNDELGDYVFGLESECNASSP